MTLYIDCYFLLNFIMCYMQLYLTKLIYNKKSNLLRIFIGAITGTLYSVVVLFKSLGFLWYIVSALAVWFSFKFNGYKDYFKTLLTFYVILFVFGGCAYAFMNKFEIKLFIVATSVSYVILWLFGEFFKNIKIKSNSLVEVRVMLNSEEIILNGLIDTGNSLKDPYTNLPVMIVAHCFDNLKTRLVPFNSVGKQGGLIKVFTPDKVIIDNKEVSCAIGIYENRLSADSTFNAILNPEIIY